MDNKDSKLLDKKKAFEFIHKEFNKPQFKKMDDNFIRILISKR